MSNEDATRSPEYPADFLQHVRTMAQYRYGEAVGGDITLRTDAALALILDTARLKRWQSAGVQCAASIDTKGLKMDLGDEGNKKGIHTHIPFAMFDAESLAALERASTLLPEKDLAELRRVAMIKRGETQEAAAITEQQIEDLVSQIEWNLHPESSFIRGRTKEALETALLSYVVRTPQTVSFQMRYSSCHLPETTIRMLLSMPHDPHSTAAVERTGMKERVLALLALAEDINRSTREVDYFSESGANMSRFLRLSHDPARVTSRVYDARRVHLRRDQNYEAVKIFNAVFELFTADDLQSMGLTVTRGKFREGTQFVAVWNESVFHRLYLDPENHFSDAAYERIMGARASIKDEPVLSVEAGAGVRDVLERPEFEFFEALMLPYRAFNDLRRSLPHALAYLTGHSQAYENERTKNELAASLSGLMTIAETEFGVEDFTRLYAQIRVIRKAIRLRSLSSDQVSAFTQELTAIGERYTDSMKGRSGREVIALRKGNTVVSDHAFDKDYFDFVATLPENLRKKCSVDPRGEPTKTHILSVDEKGLSFAQEPEVMRKLSLRPGPVITVIGGASKMKHDGETVSQTDLLAQSLHDVSLELGAHILGPETDVGFGAALGRVNRDFIARTTEEERKKLPKIFGVGPGRDLAFANNRILDRSEGSAAWPATSMDIIASPFHAGWSQHDARSEQIRHNYYRQALTRRIAGEYAEKDGRGTIITHPRLAVVGNGGAWAVLEVLAALEDDTPILCVEDSGRFAQFLSGLAAMKDRWAPVVNDDEELTAALNTIIGEIEPEDARAEIVRDFENPMYRSELIEILQLGKIDLIHHAGLTDLKSNVMALMRV